MAKLFNGARMTSATTGVAGTATTMTLGSAVGGYLSFAGAGVADQDVVTYAISDGTAFEIGRGTYTSAGTTLSRTTIIKSTNSNLAIALSGSQQVYITAAAEDIVQTSSANPFFGFGPAHNAQISASVATNALTIALKTNAGADATATTPIQIPFRDATIANGGPLWRQVTGALSVVVPSGQALGTLNATAFRFWIVAIDNAGTVELGVINCIGLNTGPIVARINSLAEHQLQTTAAIASGTGSGTIYSTTARTSKAITILGYVEYSSGLTTAGTYASAPTQIQLFGPGVKKPGESIQRAALFSAAQSTTTSATMTASNTTLSLTPTSTANLTVIDWGGNAGTNNGNLSTCLCQLFRGATAVGPQFFGGDSAISGLVVNGVTSKYIDYPQTTSSTTYTVKFSGQDGVTQAQFGNGGSGTLVLEEIMG